MPNCKYLKQQEIVSYNGGVDWQDVMPAQYRKGQLIEHDSEDCGELDTTYRWRKLTGVYLCVDDVKYEKLILDESYDGGLSWYPAYPSEYTTGEEIGVDEDYCNDKFVGHYEVINTGSATICPSGFHWNGFECVRNSRGADPIKVVKCDGNPELTSADTSYYSSSYYIFPLISAEIGKCVTSIAARAFSQNTSITNISIPDSVTTIGGEAFRYCISLSGMNTTIPGELNIPSGVTSIGNYAFMNCTGLTSIVIPSTVTSIGKMAFSGCSGTTSITVNATTPPSLGDDYAFLNTNNCPIYVPCGSYGAYQLMWNMYRSRLSPIGGEICALEKAVYRYSGVSFTYYCDGDTSISSIYTDRAGAARSAITGVSIGDCVTTIGDRAFSGCGFTSVIIPSGVTSIDTWAFYYCASLTSVTIGNGVTSIGSSAFTSCSSLASITIPSGVTSIGDYAFKGCYVTAYTFNATTPPTIGTNALHGSSGYKIYVPCDSVYDYKAASGWSEYSSIIEAIPGSCHIGKWKATYQDWHTESAECDSSSAITAGEITSPNIMMVEIGDCVKWIATSAFKGYTSLTNVTIGSGVTDIYDEAFSGCTSLSSCTMGSGVTSIGNSAFRSCSSLASITIPSGVTSIGSYAFGGTNLSLHNVYVKATTPPTAGEYIFGSTYSSSLRIHIPSGTLNAYKNANGWSTYRNYLTTS